MIREVSQVFDQKPGQVPFGIHMMIGKNYTVFLADTTINERPSAVQLAHIARETAAVAKRLGHEPRVAFLSYSTFGNPPGQWLDNIRTRWRSSSRLERSEWRPTPAQRQRLSSIPHRLRAANV